VTPSHQMGRQMMLSNVRGRLFNVREMLSNVREMLSNVSEMLSNVYEMLSNLREMLSNVAAARTSGGFLASSFSSFSTVVYSVHHPAALILVNSAPWFPYQIPARIKARTASATSHQRAREMLRNVRRSASVIAGAAAARTSGGSSSCIARRRGALLMWN